MLGKHEKGIIDSIKAYDESKGRILSYYVFHPSCGELCLKLMERYNDRNIFRGVKIHPAAHGTYADDKLYEPVWQFASEYGLPIMSHTWEVSSYNAAQRYSYPPLFREYIENFRR